MPKKYDAVCVERSGNTVSFVHAAAAGEIRALKH
jgi:hypothetical protein